MIVENIRSLRYSILKPIPRLTLVEWADKYRYLSPESSSKSGRWKTSQVEVARGVMEAYTDHDINKITVMSCTQLLKTELINNIAGYHMHLDPCPLIVMQPNEKLGEAWAKDRLDKMLRDSPSLHGKVRGTLRHRMFDGGQLSVIGSNAPGDLAMRPVKIVLCDEVDKYPSSAGGEGDPITLIAERQAVFWDRKIVQVCSPTLEETSRIYQEYKRSDQRKYHAKCVHCETAQVLVWKNVRWEDDDPSTAKYYCIECKKAWSERDRKNAITNGYWQATAESKGHAGFQISKLYSIWETMPEIAQKFADAQNNTEMLKVFINTQLAEVWRSQVEIADWRKIYNRRDSYANGSVPLGGLILTAAADVQQDRVEIEIVAWGRNLECWLVDYIVINKSITNASCRNDIKILANKIFYGESGYEFNIKMFAIDSGYNTQFVYDLVRGNQKKFMAVKGVTGSNKPILSPPTLLDVSNKHRRLKGGVALWNIGVYTAKDEIFSKLALEYDLDEDTGEITYPAGYYHFNDQPTEYFKMLCSEALVTEKDKNGYTQYIWKKTRKRNEVLDCRVYNRAAAARLGIDKLHDKNWNKLEKLTKNAINN